MHRPDGHPAATDGRVTQPLPPLALAAVGVVFGDIGTSPLYAFKQAFTVGHGVQASVEHIIGLLSLIVWALIGVVCIKYATFVLRADHHGEGGDLALLALLRPISRVGIPPKLGAIGLLVLFGTGMLYGDGVITPAISVLSAVEGLNVATRDAQPYVVIISAAILVGVFAVQRFGTGKIASVYGPIMALWFASIAVAGVVALAHHPAVLFAFDPRHAVGFLLHNGWTGMLVLGAVVLCVSGVEALYADLGHFGRTPIRLAWYAVVFPALLLNYFGQGALTIRLGGVGESPFYALFPGWALYPEVVLATAATVIASQALISGAFSLTQQAIALGFAPRLRIVHTSREHAGRIYVPTVNTLLAIACIALVVTFRHSERLGAAYGLAVSVTMLATSVNFFAVARSKWGWSLWTAVPVVGFFLMFDVLFLVGNIPKIFAGGWIPLSIAIAVFALFTTWIDGRRRIAISMAAHSVPVDQLVDIANADSAIQGAKRSAIFLTAHPEGIPFALRHQWLRQHLAQDPIVLLTIVNERVPFVASARRVAVERKANRLMRVTAHYGFLETPSIDAIVASCADEVTADALAKGTYFLARARLVAHVGKGGMPRPRRALYAYLLRNARPLPDSLGLPIERTVEFGVEVKV
jgi:KUP system potassium uptake protein